MLRSTFETALYFKEMLIRLGRPKQMDALCNTCLEHPELNCLFGYASRLKLRTLLPASEITPDKLSTILNTYVDIYGSTIDQTNIEPGFELEMERYWQLIAQHLQHAEPSTLNPVLDRLTGGDGGEWNSLGNLVFMNDRYKVDLKTWKVSLLDNPLSLGPIPNLIRMDFFLKELIGHEKLDEVLIEEIDEVKTYSFRDKDGISTRIEDHEGNYSLYKEIEVNGNLTWLQAIDLRPSSRKDSGFFAAIASFKKEMREMYTGKPEISLFNQGVYVNPNQPSQGYVLNGAKIDFELKLKKVSKNLEVSKAWDYRKLPASGPWEIYNAAQLEDKSLQFLKVFENVNETFLWAKKGKLKRVEFPRYGLTFALKGGRLLCETEPYKGYTINPEGYGSDYPQALLLEHIDSQKRKQLLFGDPDALTAHAELQLPKAKAFAYIPLFFHYAGLISDMMSGKAPELVYRESSIYNRSKTELKCTAFKIRATTGEVCKTKATWPHDALVLIKHALAANRPIMALEKLNEFPLKEVLKDHQLLKAVTEFVCQKSKSSSNAALKYKLVSRLLKLLKKHKRLNGNVQLILKEAISNHRKLVGIAGRAVPALLLTQDVKAPELAKEVRRLEDDELGVKIKRLDQKESLLFNSSDLEKLFRKDDVKLDPIVLTRGVEELFETKALDSFQEALDTYRSKTRSVYVLKKEKGRISRFIENKLVPLQAQYEAQMNRLKKKIDKIGKKGTDPENQLSIFSKETIYASFPEIRLSFAQGRLQELQTAGRLPPTCDVAKLEEHLFGYFDAFSRKNAVSNAISLMQQMKGLDQEDSKNWNLLSDEIHRLLTLKRKYDPKENPSILVFEAQVGKNLKKLPGNLSQLGLLEVLLEDPASLVQAPTGAGKTTVLSVLQSLLKPNGKNLVIQKVLPPLYDQTLDQTREVVGDLFDTLVIPLRFNLKMPLSRIGFYKEGNEEKRRPVSIFKGMYDDLFSAIHSKGCVLTDYTSLPLLEAKYIQIGGKITEFGKENVSELELEHFDYLRKILVLLRCQGVESMDEFDGPNRPIQKLQLDLQLGSHSIAAFMFETTLEIYELLAKDPALGLENNLQMDISDPARAAAIQDAARAMAAKFVPQDKVEALYNYFIGESETIFDDAVFSPKELDCLAVCKNQFSIYLALTLKSKEGSCYKRSEDGSKTVPCQKGERHDAKQGTLYEQMNYVIQDYKQKKITNFDLKSWFQVFKPEWDQATGDLKEALKLEFKSLFADQTVQEVARRIEQNDPLLVSEISLDEQKVLKFLILRLQNLKSNGYRISLDPVNIVDMSRAVSGVSATMGAKGSLHHQFKPSKTCDTIKAQMAYRIMGRAQDKEKVLPYDPRNPGALLTVSYDAIIDGAGAFNDSTQRAARNLLDSNPILKQVGYHNENGSIEFQGDASPSIAETGFVFNESHTRGTDIALGRKAHALLTVNQHEGLRNLAQEEGRLRQEGQTFDISMPSGQAKADLVGVISSAECVDAAQDAKDIYRHQLQAIAGDLRNQMLEKLLACEEIDDFIVHFKKKECQSLFISEPEKVYVKPGDYFKDHRAHIKENVPVKTALEAKYREYQSKAIALDLSLEKMAWPAELLEKMPSFVSLIQADLECELQVEVEQDIELEVELEMDLQLEVENEDNIDQNPFEGVSDERIPGRTYSTKKASVTEKIHRAYDPILFVTEAFLPFKRNLTHKSIRRLPFEQSMYRVGEVIFELDNENIERAFIEDPFRDYRAIKNKSFFIYDVRLDSVVKTSGSVPKIIAEKCKSILVQIKFLDGRTKGYSPSELADLEAWLVKSGPKEMKRHMLEDILRFRYREKLNFEHSQLGELFRKLLVFNS